MSSVAIITARGGSKRIPHKNIKDFCGKPIIAYSIEAALKSELFDEVMVSTDDDEIAAISMKHGAKVPFRRTEQTSDDFSTTADVLSEVLRMYKEQRKVFEYACCIYPTAPFVTVEKLSRAYAMLVSEKACQSVLTVTSFSFPPQRGLLEVEGEARWWQPEFAYTRSQDLPKIYHDAGQFYFFRVNGFLVSRSLIGAGSKMLIVPETEVQDIDNLTDWELAEMKYEKMTACDSSEGHVAISNYV